MKPIKALTKITLLAAFGAAGLHANGAQAAACNTYTYLSDLIAAGNSCEVNTAGSSLTLTHVSYSGFNPAQHYLSASTVPTITTNPSSATIGLSFESTTFSSEASPFNWTYTLTSTTKYLSNYTTTLNSSQNSGNNTAIFSTSNASGGSANVATFSPGGTNGIIANGGFVYTNPSLYSDTFSQTLDVTQGAIESLSTSFNFVNPPAPTATPGPLPVIGAAAAFSFSRRLRTRLKAVKA